MVRVDAMRVWTDLDAESGRRFRRTLILSAVGHGVLFSFLFWLSPAPPSSVLPQAISVSLLAAVPAPPPTAENVWKASEVTDTEPVQSPMASSTVPRLPAKCPPFLAPMAISSDRS